MSHIIVHFESCDISFTDGVSTDPASLSLVGMFLFEKINNLYTDKNILSIVNCNLKNMYWIECTKVLDQLRVNMTIKKVFN